MPPTFSNRVPEFSGIVLALLAHKMCLCPPFSVPPHKAKPLKISVGSFKTDHNPKYLHCSVQTSFQLRSASCSGFQNHSKSHIGTGTFGLKWVVLVCQMTDTCERGVIGPCSAHFDLICNLNTGHNCLKSL